MQAAQEQPELPAAPRCPFAVNADPGSTEIL